MLLHFSSRALVSANRLTSVFIPLRPRAIFSYQSRVNCFNFQNRVNKLNYSGSKKKVTKTKYVSGVFINKSNAGLLFSLVTTLKRNMNENNVRKPEKQRNNIRHF